MIALGRVLTLLQTPKPNAIRPNEFLSSLRRVFPQFGQKGNDGDHMQQDAEECLSSILNTLGQKVSKLAPPEGGQNVPVVTPDNSIVNQLFAFQTESKYLILFYFFLSWRIHNCFIFPISDMKTWKLKMNHLSQNSKQF